MSIFWYDTIVLLYICYLFWIHKNRFSNIYVLGKIFFSIFIEILSNLFVIWVTNLIEKNIGQLKCCQCIKKVQCQNGESVTLLKCTQNCFLFIAFLELQWQIFLQRQQITCFGRNKIYSLFWGQNVLLKIIS